MKKIFITLSIIIASAIVNKANAQAVDQFTALESIGEGSIFRSYWGITTENGSTTGQASDNYELKFEKDVPTRGDAFLMVAPGTDTKKINSSFGFLEANHLTKPSFFYDNNTVAYIYINGLLYKLIKVKDPNNVTSFEIDDLYTLMKPVKGTDLSGKLAMKEMKTRDHKAVILQYLADMKVIQETATSNYTDDEKNKLVMREQAKADKAAGIQAKNAAYWNSEEGQRVLAKSKQAEVTLVNDTQGSVYLCYGQGASYDLKPGQKKTFACSGGKVYRGTLRPNNSSQYDATNNVLLDLNGSDCGRTVNASGVIR